MSAPTTEQLLIRRGLQKRLGREVADWATDQLVRGVDTPHLRQLAGVSGAEGQGELEDLFDRTSRELGLETPSPEEAVALYAQGLARDYLAGTLGTGEVSQRALAALHRHRLSAGPISILSLEVCARGPSEELIFSLSLRRYPREF